MVVGTRAVKLFYRSNNHNIHLSAVSAMKLTLKCIRGSGSYMHNSGHITEWSRAQSQAIFVTERAVNIFLYNGNRLFLQKCGAIVKFMLKYILMAWQLCVQGRHMTE